METLATIAYRQLITRAKIGQIRGVSVSNKILCLLQEREWIKITGYEEIIGRPALYVTTQCFFARFLLAPSRRSTRF